MAVFVVELVIAVVELFVIAVVQLALVAIGGAD